jgi:hypothetical protein
VNHAAARSVPLNLAALAGFCALLFLVSLRNISRKWIA